MFREAMLVALFLTMFPLSLLTLGAQHAFDANTYTLTSIETLTNTTVGSGYITQTVTYSSETFVVLGFRQVTYTVASSVTQYYVLTNKTSMSGLSWFQQMTLSYLSPTIIVGIAAIVVTVIIYMAQRRKKSLTYEVLSETALLRRQEELEGRLQILFDSKPIKDAYLLLIRFENNGNTPILQTDFERPVYINLGKETQVLICDTSAKKPEALKPKLLPETGRISIEPLLLNSRDSFNVKAIVSQYDHNSLKIDGRIAGVKEIEQPSKGFWRQELPLAATMFAVFFTVVLFGLVSESFGGRFGSIANSFILVLTLVIVIVSYGLLLYARGSR